MKKQEDISYSCLQKFYSIVMFKTISSRSANSKFRIYLTLTVLWMVVIFLFSAQNAQQSSSLSDGIFYQLATFFHIPKSAMETLTFFIRKGAHMSEYAMLALLSYLTLSQTAYRRHRFLYVLVFVFLYACTDEFHQLFVPGRAGMFQDVLIDTSGGLLMLVCIQGIETLRTRRHKHSST